jgi:hypothetical protein
MKKTKTNFSGLLEGFLLFIVSLLITIPLTALALIFTPLSYILNLRLKKGINELGIFFRRLAISVDQFGNAATATLLDFFLIKKHGVKFGNEDDTVSYILGLNKNWNTLTRLGRFTVLVLHVIEKNHVEKAVKMKIKADQEAAERFKNNAYYK